MNFPVKMKTGILRLSLLSIAFSLLIPGLFHSCFVPGETSKEEDSAALLLLGQFALENPISRPCADHTAAPPATTAIADVVVSAPAATGQGFGDTACLTNGIRGGGYMEGSIDVFSLDDTGAGASVVLAWSERRVANGAGIDFVVFENPFRINGDPANVFLEPLLVEVSENGSEWCAFAVDYNPAPAAETDFSANPAHWLNFAGITPVLYHQENNPLSASDLFDPTVAGGDGFDLNNLDSADPFGTGCTIALRDALVTGGFVYLRLTSAGARINPDSSLPFPDAGPGGPDIDGVIARTTAPR